MLVTHEQRSFLSGGYPAGACIIPRASAALLPDQEHVCSTTDGIRLEQLRSCRECDVKS